MKPLPEDWDRAVAVVAHPDDLEYGVASAVARWTGQGKTVTYLLATWGEAGIAGMPPDQVAPLRVEEERRSAAVVGVSEVDFLDHRDGVVEYGLPLRRDLAAAFRRLQPEVIITMSFDLTWGEEGPVNHADHRAVGLAVLDACRDAANGWVFTGDGPPWTGIRDAYVAASGNPTHFVDVTATIDAGVASLREHRAYLEGLGRKFDPDEFLKNMAGFVGLAAGCEYAVGFRRYPMGQPSRRDRTVALGRNPAATPGHTAQDITTLAATDGGLVACTHVWQSKQGPDQDPLAEDQDLLERSRAKLLAAGPALIVPGHGEPFRPGELAAGTP